jgi:4-hydroxy-tetrahydrodipicolinate synthase
MQLGLLELHGLMFAEPNPAPAKAALAALIFPNAAVRLPLVAASEGLHRQIGAALARATRAGA